MNVFSPVRNPGKACHRPLKKAGWHCSTGAPDATKEKALQAKITADNGEAVAVCFRVFVFNCWTVDYPFQWSQTSFYRELEIVFAKFCLLLTGTDLTRPLG